MTSRPNWRTDYFPRPTELRPSWWDATRTSMGPDQDEHCVGCGERLLSMNERVSIGSQEQKNAHRWERCKCEEVKTVADGVTSVGAVTLVEQPGPGWSPEPWSDPNNERAPVHSWSTAQDGKTVVHFLTGPDYARAAVCVDACKGLPTEVIKDKSLAALAREKWERAIAQRDKLADAIRNYIADGNAECDKSGGRGVPCGTCDPCVLALALAEVDDSTPVAPPWPFAKLRTALVEVRDSGCDRLTSEEGCRGAWPSERNEWCWPCVAADALEGTSDA